jgi:hypothetical protein
MRKTALSCAVIGAGTLAGCRPTQPTEAREVPELKLEGVGFRLYRGDALRLSGQAATLTYRRDTHDLAAGDLSANVIELGEEPMAVTAPEGAGNVARHTFEIHGGVTLARADDVARTAAAAYAPGGSGKGLVTGHDPVVVDGRGYELHGTGFTFDPATGVLLMEGGARLDAGLEGPR